MTLKQGQSLKVVWTPEAQRVLQSHELLVVVDRFYYLYSDILRSRADSLCSHVILHEWQAFLNIHWSGVLTALTWLVPHEPAVFMQSHIRKVHACSAVTCHLHFWQNDWDLLRASAVTQGWNGYRNKSQHRKLTVEKKILLLLPLGLEPVTFQSQVLRSNHRAIPTLTFVIHSLLENFNTEFLLGQASQNDRNTVHNTDSFFIPVKENLYVWS